MISLTALVAAALALGAGFYLSLVVMGVLSRSAQVYQERYVVKSAKDLGDLFLFISPRDLLLLNLAFMALSAMVAYLAINLFAAIAAGALGFFFPSMFVKQYRARRLRKFNQQLVDALQALANGMKAGLTFQQSVEQVTHEAEAPLSQEFGLFIKEVKLGVLVDDALVNLSKRVGSDDLELVVTATNISRQLGGNLAELFETISATIRDRFRIEGKIDSITAQGRLQGYIVAALPLLLGVVMNYMRPDLMQPMLAHLFGWVLIGFIAVFEIAGILLIRRIMNIDI